MTFEHTANGNRFGVVLSLDDLVLPKFVLESVKNITIANNRIHSANFCEPTQVRVDTSKIGWEFIGNGGLNLGQGQDPLHPFVGLADPLNSGLPYMYSDENEGVNDLRHKVPVGHNRFSSYVGPAGFVAPGIPATNNGLAAGGGGNSLYPQLKNDFLDYKGAEANYYRRGYWRDEYYRFAIVLHYKDGTWGFADRIKDPATGYDIKFPNIAQYPLTYFEAPVPPDMDGDWYKLILGIRFTNIDLSGIAHLIKGFSIVRAPRTDQDKTIRCEGVLTPLYEMVFNGKTQYSPFFNIWQAQTGEFRHTHPPLPSHNQVWLLSPELDFAKTVISAGDKIDITYKVSGRLLRNFTPGNPPAVLGLNLYAKAYKFSLIVSPFSPFSSFVQGSKWFDVGDEGYIYTNSGDAIFVNLNNVSNILGTFDFTMLGAGTALILKTNLPFGISFYDYTENVPDNVVPFDQETVWDYFIARTEKTPDKIYGGSDVTGVANQQYIPTGHYQKVDENENNRGKNGAYIFDADVFGGDTFINFYSRVTSFNNNGDDPGFLVTPQQSSVIFPVQTTINTDLRFEQKNDEGKTVKAIVEKNLTVDDFKILFIARHGGNALTDLQGEAFLQSDVYNKDESAWFFAARPIDFDKLINCSFCFPAQIIASKERTFGERYNSWTQILANERAELDLKFGGITEIETLSHEARLLVFWQENGAFGITPVDNQSLKISTTAEAVLGTGRLYGQHRYLSETVGCRHKWGIQRTDKGWYWFDANTKGFYFSDGKDEPKNIGEIAGMSNWFGNHTDGINNIDNPIYKGGINLGWDYLHGDVMICFHPVFRQTGDIPVLTGDEWTLTFNESAGKFIAFYSFYPRMCMDISGNRILTPNPTFLSLNKDVRMLFTAVEYCKFYDFQTNNDSAYVVFALNEKHELTKEPGFIHLYTNKLWKRIEVLNNPQFDRYGGQYQTRCTIPTNLLFQARGGKWEGPIPVGTDLFDFINSVWQPNVTLQRIMGEQIFIKLSANVIEIVNGQPVYDFSNYDIHAATIFYAVSKRNS
jgi:hypothetical protein